MRTSFITLIFALNFVYTSFGIEKLGRINDPDGYTNVREKPSITSKVVFKILSKEYFYYEKTDNKNWYKLINMDGKSGYIHKSRVEHIKSIVINGKSYDTEKSKLKIRTKKIGNTRIKIFQVESNNGFCNSYVEITGNRNVQFTYEDIQALGGDAGIAFLENSIPNHVLIVKHGDYNGKTILISKKGNVTEVNGGSVSKLVKNKYVLNFEECDLGFCSLSVYDINREKVVFEYETEFELYDFDGKIILDLDIEEEEDLRVLNLDKLSLDEFKVDSIFKRKRYRQFLQRELKENCLCTD
ncbi:SH3 domain-containing protein [Tenacibaculum sp. 190524A05c]|uniref:SH3b domain-containing protein n=1 Tax=Tenacibaculum platacis TaxID=3137852 RepID=A0ABP1ESZ8_9FLAO